MVGYSDIWQPCPSQKLTPVRQFCEAIASCNPGRGYTFLCFFEFFFFVCVVLICCFFGLVGCLYVVVFVFCLA